MELELSDKIQYLKGVGPKLAEKLHKLGLETVSDLLLYWPRAYKDYSEIIKIKELDDQIRNLRLQNQNDNIATIRGRILSIENKLTSRRRMKVTEAVVEDGTGSIKLIWFNQPFLLKLFKPGNEWIFNGKLAINFYARELTLESPSFVREPIIVPIYPETAGISSGYLNKLILSLRPQLLKIVDFVPQKVLEEYKLLPLQQAITHIHQPQDQHEIAESRRRLAFDELFLVSLRSRLAKVDLAKRSALPIVGDNKSKERFIKSLPFSLTDDQEKAISEISSDMAKSVPMNRLLNGDVGSGKTVVAATAAFAAAKSGFRTVLMVPTEVLASQHFETFSKLFDRENISVGLLTSSMKRNSKLALRLPSGQASQPASAADGQVSKSASSPPRLGTGIPEGVGVRGGSTKDIPPLAPPTLGGGQSGATQSPQDADIVIGTQALLQKNIHLENVNLVITDEQHRFGVNQRAALKNNLAIEQFNNSVPHFLSMTATPIPRTLHLALFGDLEVSLIKEKPQDRKEIKTRFVEPHNRMKAYDFIRSQINRGRQVFVICPLIEETENESAKSLFDEDRKSVTKEYVKLSKTIFPDLKIAMLHGKMKPKEKESIMSDFSHKKYDILVSTSVIEVGVDIPNATVMMVEDADRFGLAQTHQFRGRVGRAEHQSFCFLFSNTQSPKTLERLKNLEKVSDGFKLAEIDLETRGPGDIFGTMQSGDLELKLASLSDRITLEQASQAARDLVLEDSDLGHYPELREKIRAIESSRHFE